MYTTTKALLTTRQVELIGKKEFVTTIFDIKDEAFVVYITFISKNSSDHLFYRV